VTPAIELDNYSKWRQHSCEYIVEMPDGEIGVKGEDDDVGIVCLGMIMMFVCRWFGCRARRVLFLSVFDPPLAF